MKVAIVSGAPKAWLDLEDIKSSFIIGVDRGALILIEHGISPHVSNGDFDSVTKSELEQIKASSLELIQLPSEKDETDTEVALNYLLTKKVSSIKLYGVIGGRIDHTLANTRLLQHFAKKGLPLT